jgi:nucleotide-binding universal stress UspA family protein
MLRHILVPVDGSKLAERALVLALPLADQHGAAVTLLTVHEPIFPITVGGGAPVREPALDSKWRDDHQAYLTKLAKRVTRRTQAPVETVFRDGPVVPTILDERERRGADLIVMSTHGRGGLKRLWLGSIADQVARRAKVPVLLTRGGRAPGSRLPQDPLFRRVLVPLDGSPRAESALATVEALLGGARGAVTLAHVVHPMTAAAARSLERRPELDVATSYLEPLAARLRRNDRPVTPVARVDGNVAQALLTIADETDADLIALTSQGMNAAERLIIGSIADKLVRSARVPVLLCPERGATA